MDARANAFLGLDPQVDGLIYCVGVGTPDVAGGDREADPSVG